MKAYNNLVVRPKPVLGKSKKNMENKRELNINSIRGKLRFPPAWTVFAPIPKDDPLPGRDILQALPSAINSRGKTIRAETVTSTRHQFDFQKYFGPPPYEATQAAYVFIPLDSDTEQEVTLGMGADWYLQAWLNGAPVFDTLKDGNKYSPPSIHDHRVTVKLSRGQNILAVRFLNGRGGAVLALGGPEELRKGDFKSIVPPPVKLDAAGLFAKYPADPEAPLKWAPPEGFDPHAEDLGLPHLKEAGHCELMHASKSRAPLDEGGTGIYESRQHGTWNHSLRVAVFRDRLIALWRNHALDEGGPGVRILGRAGKILNEQGEVDWGGPEALLEVAPAPVPVRRRKYPSDGDKVRGAAARGEFFIIGARLFFCGCLVAKHGVTSNPAYGIWEGMPGNGRMIPASDFALGPGPGMRSWVEWDLGFKFYQEWDVRDDKFQPVSPIYRENDLPEKLALTPELTLPLEPLVKPYRDAPLLAAAPRDFQELIRGGERKGFCRSPRYRPGTRRLAHDGLNGLAHGAEFKRPDGAWVAVRENQKPQVQPFYYAAEKPDEASFYPPARRTNLFGAVNPAAGELPDGSAFIVGNSPNRRTMYIAVARDGKLFDRTWFLLHRQLKSFTPGAMKNEGGPGSGPQYFEPAVVGQSLWLVYSISKEHIGATRVPVASLAK